jgi:MFS family permease
MVGAARLAAAGYVVFFAGFIVTALAWNPVWLFPAMALVATGSAFTNPTMNAFVSQRSAASEQGAILGTVQSVLSLTRVAGPAWAGAVFDHFGTGAPYWSGAGFILLALVLAMPDLRASQTEML